MTTSEGFELPLGLDDFARLFGTTIDNISAECRQLIHSLRFCYRKSLSLRARKPKRKPICQLGNSAGRQGREARWEKGWGENLQDLLTAGAYRQLVPKASINVFFPTSFSAWTRHTFCRGFFRANWFEIFRLTIQTF